MIIVKFTSGLGNQMFQYNLYSLLKEIYKDTQVKADITWFGRSSEHQGFELQRLFQRSDNKEFELQLASKMDILSCTGRIPNIHKGFWGDMWQNVLRVPHAIIRKFSGDKYQRMHIDQSGFEDNQEIYNCLMNLDSKKNWYISGFFIEEIYYKDRLPKLRQMLVFDTDFSDENIRLVDMIQNTDSVSIHVRRGDYLSAKYSSDFVTLSMDYYRESIEAAMKARPDTHFFIFSDDKDFISAEFGWIDEKYPLENQSRITVVTGNVGSQSFRDMQLMSMCKRNIIANSTFSVWAGLLNSSRDAEIYYPRTYMKKKDSEIKTIPGWIRVG